MINKERYDKYINEHCVNCKNKDTNLCEIRITNFDDTITTKCLYYERDLQRRNKRKGDNNGF